MWTPTAGGMAVWQAARCFHSKSRTAFVRSLCKLGHNAQRHNISTKIDNQVNCTRHSWIITLELSKSLTILVLHGNHHVMLTWLLTAQEFNELDNSAPKNVVVTDGRCFCQFGTLVQVLGKWLFWRVLKNIRVYHLKLIISIIHILSVSACLIYIY